MEKCKDKSKRKKTLGVCAIVFAIFAVVVFILYALLECET